MISNNSPETNAFVLILDSKCTPYSDNAQQLEELANFARKLERERDAYIDKFEQAEKQLEAMREAIKEARKALDNCVEFINDAQIIEAQWHWEPVKQSKAALAKPQPFLKP